MSDGMKQGGEVLALCQEGWVKSREVRLQEVLTGHGGMVHGYICVLGTAQRGQRHAHPAAGRFQEISRVHERRL
ncbi:hypothetical protein SLI_6353 [Streptomyces lividans 1326]|uniref:Uncharacterized protein n=1 Tax=Streptomyces lividans 1326 TaxID=1200984 RepID=A0A7U9DXM3_STRLI|nr:hypothetical protein SLI_6353 [Streptomyces lividans 1326]